MNGHNDFFMKMCQEATEELAKGGKGWKEADANTLLLACFGMLANSLSHRITRPLWAFASSVAIGVIIYIIISVWGI